MTSPDVYEILNRLPQPDAQELRAALEGYHKGADSIPYAQWSREQHAADIALKRTML
jgi:hypothetical protein